MVTNHYNSKYDSLDNHMANSIIDINMLYPTDYFTFIKVISASYHQYECAYDTLYSSKTAYINQLLLNHLSPDNPAISLYKSSLLRIVDEIELSKRFEEITADYGKLRTERRERMWEKEYNILR